MASGIGHVENARRNASLASFTACLSRIFARNALKPLRTNRREPATCARYVVMCDLSAVVKVMP